MDSRRFDDLAKALATGTSRRGMLKGLAGALAGGTLAFAGGRRANAARGYGRFCTSGAQCATGYCKVYPNGNGRCFCPPGTMLCNGQCIVDTCPPGHFLNTSCQCQVVPPPPPPTCPSGTMLCNGQCIVDTCPPGQFLNANCQCEVRRPVGAICSGETAAGDRECSSGQCGCGPGACTCRSATCATPGGTCTLNDGCCTGLCMLTSGAPTGTCG